MEREQLFLARMTQQGLINPSEDLEQVFQTTIGMQAQQQRQTEVGIALRTRKVTYTDLLARYQSGRVVRTWAQRWTYQLLQRDDWELIIAARRGESLPQTYFRGERARIMSLADKLAADLHPGQVMTQEDAMSLLAHHADTNGDHHLWYVVMQILAARGLVTFNPALTGLQTEIRVMPAPTVDTDVAMRQLMDRFVRGFGPVRLADFCKWAGIGASRARANWQQCAAQWQPVGEPGDGLYVAASIAALPDDTLTGRALLVGGFDGTLTAYADKGWLALPPAKLWTANGILKPFVIIDGVIGGTWSTRWRGDKVDFAFETWRSVPRRLRTQIEAQCERVARFFNVAVGSISY